MLECGAQNCFPNCLLPECPNAIVVGITNCNWYECTANQNPIYPRVLNPNDPNDREIKVGAFYTDVRVHLAWIKQMITKNGGTYCICILHNFNSNILYTMNFFSYSNRKTKKTT